MKKRAWIWTALGGCLALAAVGVAVKTLRARQGQPPNPICPELVDGRNALEETRLLVDLGPRHAGTPGAERAARHLARRLETLGVKAVIEEFRDTTPRGEMTFRNVLGVIPGESDRIILLLSHYDTKSGLSKAFVGANDSGSSSGLLIELARVLRQSQPLPCNFILAFLDGEECQVAYGPNDGLHGSRYLASRMKTDGRADDVQAVILMDMVGDEDLSLTLPRNNSPVLMALLFEAAREEGVRDKFALAPGSILDDHVPFLAAGMPALDIIDLQYGSLPGKNDYWHTVQDTMDRISHRSLEIVGRVVVRLLNKLIAQPAAPAATDTPPRTDG